MIFSRSLKMKTSTFLQCRFDIIQWKEVHYHHHLIIISTTIIIIILKKRLGCKCCSVYLKSVLNDPPNPLSKMHISTLQKMMMITIMMLIVGELFNRQVLVFFQVLNVNFSISSINYLLPFQIQELVHQSLLTLEQAC